MGTVRQVLVGLFSVVFLVGGVTLVTPLGSVAQAAPPAGPLADQNVEMTMQHDMIQTAIQNQMTTEHGELSTEHSMLETDHDDLATAIATLQSAVDLLGGGAGNHTLRWDKILDSTDGSDIGGREGCDSSRFKCIFEDTAVVDLETGLVWERSPSITGGTGDGSRKWIPAIIHCADRAVGGRKGWSLPMWT